MGKDTRQVFVHLHIPKCGGSTVVDFLGKNFGRHLYSTNSILNDYQYDANQILRIIYQNPNLICLTGHKLSLNLPYYHKNLDIHSFTWIRDPVKRFISHYFYHRNHTDLIPETKSMDLIKYSEWALKDGNQKMYINGQMKFLGGGSIETIKSLVTEGKLLLFPLSKLQQSFYTIEHKFPGHFTNIPKKNRNISKKDQEIPANYHKLILPYVEEDMKLLELSNHTTLANNRMIRQMKTGSSRYKEIWENKAWSCSQFLHRVAYYLESRR